MKKRCSSYNVEKASLKSGIVWKIRLNIIVENDDGTKKYPQHIISTNLPAVKSNLRRAYEIAEEEMNKYNCQSQAHPMEMFFDDWLKWKKDTLEASTFEAYDYRIKYMRSYFINNHLTVENINPETVKDFYQFIFHLKKRDGNNLSNRTIKDVLNLFRTIMDDAVFLKIINENPCGRLQIPQRPVSVARKPYIGGDQVEAFFEEIKGHRLENMFIFAIYYGMRREELLPLKWNSIRDDRIYIETTMVEVKTVIEKNRTKTESSCRYYPISDHIRQILIAIKRQQEEYKKMLGDDYKDFGYVFTWEDGRPYKPHYVTKSFRYLVRKSDNLDNSLTFHSLRASCVSLLVHNGVDIKDVQEWVGHADIKTTLQIYARTDDKQQWGVANRMDNLIFGGANS